MNYSKSKQLHIKVAKILAQIESLKQHDRYRGVLIFGSVAKGEFKEGSDIDVKVIVQGDEHSELNHPVIDGVKLDLSFNSLETLAKTTSKEIKERRRIPMITGSMILFDKDGDLRELIDRASDIEPPEVDPSEHDWIEFIIYNDDLKVKRTIDNDPDTALLVMHTSLHKLLKIHYRKQGKWSVSNKCMFSDLASWDTKLENMLKSLVNSSVSKEKFSYWTQIVDHVLADFGGRKDIEETNCSCELCRSDIENLLSSEK